MIDTYDQHFKIVGIDPGTTTLGVALLAFDFDTKKLSLIEARTFSSDNTIQRYPHLREVYGDRYAKIHSHRTNLLNYFNDNSPHALASEAPFFGRLPQPYAALTECVYALRLAAMDYDIYRPLHVYDPATVKKNVGVSGKSGDKEAMRTAIKKTGILNEEQLENIAQYDEHAIDAIAVAYSHYLTLA